MRPWARLFAIALLATPLAALAEDVKTSTAGMTAEDLELARYLDLLDNFELFEKWELVELLPVLEEEAE